MDFRSSLDHAWTRSGSALCVGLDPDSTRYPQALAQRSDRVFTFCRAIVDATADLVCAFKPQIAYFAAQRAEDQLEALIAYIHERHPGIPVILDAKRGDIGATAAQYAREAFERYGADALTVNPYMGFDSIQPYLEYAGRGVIVLCRTSNPGGSDLQFLDVGGEPLYQHLARRCALDWNSSGQLGLVVGATYPAEVAKVRALAPDLPLLVPGIGAQGGDLPGTVSGGQDARGQGLIINSSRAIVYASAGEDFAEAARAGALRTRDAINQARQLA
jgi:orotidine-5'-phosphate decarboxylase